MTEVALLLALYNFGGAMLVVLWLEWRIRRLEKRLREDPEDPPD